MMGPHNDGATRKNKHMQECMYDNDRVSTCSQTGSVALCRGNASPCRSGAYVATYGTRRDALLGLHFALRGLALWLVCAIAPSFVSGWRVFSSFSLCKSICSHRETEEKARQPGTN
jgi:hypothetical protein